MENNYADEWFRLSNVDQADSPALVIYQDRVKTNIAVLLGMVGDVRRLRPHVKTHKSREATLLLMAAGIRKFKCATIAEAEMVAACGSNDILLAYQPVGPKINRLISLIESYPDAVFSCLVDEENAARNIGLAAAKCGITIPVYLDINVGMNRTGMKVDRALELYTMEITGIRSVGLHVYDGHITDPDFSTRTAQCNQAFAPVEDLERDITARGFERPAIVAGGSPTFPIHARREGVECSPGTFIYWDAGYMDTLQEQSFVPAALLITRVISCPTETIICTDLGHKAVASENELHKRIRFLNAPGLIPLGQSEEHLKLEAGRGHSYKIGDVLYGIPYHICPTCALFEKAFVAVNGKISAEWKITARDRKIHA